VASSPRLLPHYHVVMRRTTTRSVWRGMTTGACTAVEGIGAMVMRVSYDTIRNIEVVVSSLVSH